MEKKHSQVKLSNEELHQISERDDALHNSASFNHVDPMYPGCEDE